MKKAIKELLNFSPETYYIPLGDVKKMEELKKKKVVINRDKKLRDLVWGTLGWENDKPFKVNGDIQFSELGNTEDSKRNKLTKNEIDDILAINPTIKVKARKEIQEFYLNFDDVDFDFPAEPFNPLKLPRLRLTITLDKNEGALVYYQYSDRDNYNDTEAVSQYVMPEDANNGEGVSYYFPVEPKYELKEENEEKNLYVLTKEPRNVSFIVKVLIFKRKAASSSELFKTSLEEINKLERKKSGNLTHRLFGEKKYDMLIFQKGKKIGESSRFESVKKSNEIDVSKRTLLLIHGTFVDTEKSFEGLLGGAERNVSELDMILDSGQFGQILAFNHPTISADAHLNLKYLYEFFLDYKIKKFDHPICIIATSRGALVAEALCEDKRFVDYFDIEKISEFSGGHYCGYFTLGNKISNLLSVWQNNAKDPTGKLIAAIAQLPVKWFLNQPGCLMMTKGNDVAKRIYEGKPINKNIRFQVISSQAKMCLVDEYKLLKKAGAGVLNAMIRIALGKEHDRVIGVDAQLMIPKAIADDRKEIKYRLAVHGDYLTVGKCKTIDCKELKRPVQEVLDFFN